MESPSGEDSVLTKESMDAMWELDEKVLSMEVIFGCNFFKPRKGR